MPEVPFSVRVDSELLQAVRALASARDETISQVVRRLLRQYVASAEVEQVDLEAAVRRAGGAGKARTRGRKAGS